MLGLGLGEILFIAIIVLVVVGPDRLPHFMRTAGRMYGQFRRAADEMRRALVLEADRQDAQERYKKLQERRQKALEERQRATEAAGPGVVPQDPPAPEPDPDPDVIVPIVKPPDIDDFHFTEDIPPGVSVEEWVKLPPHVRDLLQGKKPAKKTEERG